MPSTRCSATPPLASITAEELGPSAAERLGALPLTRHIDGVLYCHATPRHDDEMVTRISPTARWEDVLEGADAPLVVAGHTHQQDDRAVGAVRFVNAGSVGLPYEGDGAARWLLVRDGVPELRRTPYHVAAAGRRLLAAGWPDPRSVHAALIEPVAPLEVTEIFESIAEGRRQRAWRKARRTGATSGPE